MTKPRMTTDTRLTTLMEAMELAYQKYIGPGAPGRDAYLLYHGRPVVFVFPKHGHTDWNQVRQR